MQIIPRRRTKSEKRQDAHGRAVRLHATMLERGISIADMHRCSRLAESTIRALLDGTTLNPSYRTVQHLVAGFDNFEKEQNPGGRFPPVDPVWLYDGEEGDE